MPVLRDPRIARDVPYVRRRTKDIYLEPKSEDQASTIGERVLRKKIPSGTRTTTMTVDIFTLRHGIRRWSFCEGVL